MCGFGACRTLRDVSIIHFITIKTYLGFAWLINELMLQPLIAFGCVVKAK